MKKLFAGIIVAFAIVALLVAGCGGSKSSSSPGSTGSAQAILKANQAKMKDVSSFKVQGEYTVTTPSAEVKTEKASLAGDVQIVGTDDVRAHVTATPSGGGQGSEIYVVDGWEYTFNPNKGWTKSKAQSGGLQSSGIITPNSISDMTKYAENVKLGPAENGKYVITFDIGSKFFDQIFKQAAGTTPGSAKSSEAQAAQQLAETMKELLSGLTMSMTYKVDKTTMLADSATVKVSLKGSALGDAAADINMNFTDYNAPVTVTLPPEAASAPEQTTTPGGLPNLPNIPGLGL